MHYDSDEEIDEDEAFNSEDEAKYGKFFTNTPSSSLEREPLMTSKFMGLTVPIPQYSGESKVTTVNVLQGTKLHLSFVCLDIPDFDFRQLRLLFRCLYEKQDAEDEMQWMCLCNFLVQSSNSTSVSLGLEIVGPCTVEWKVQSSSNPHDGCINIFGQIVPTDAVSSGSEISFPRRVDNSSSLKVGSNEKQTDFVHSQVDKDDKKFIDESKPSKSSKRKLDQANDNDAIDSNVKDDATPAQSIETQNEANNKLTKKQRKHLAEEKAKQLEETLTAARINESESKSKKKKKKKKPSKDVTNSSETISKPTSLTRERRLPGGILIRDILVGTGTPVSSGRKISLHYTGSLQSNGKVFDKNHSRTQPLQFRQGTGEVIRGLERGLEGMKVGGERVITVPASLGYGEKGMGESIPPDSDLVFEVKVLKVG
ncbi:hypothetical protein HJC23_001938 [Cyclotella cryptica]|uniref:peptidylprolyl isomerase n=1 Tax=Cyclotella cryptica TaxID=29204 RepID=A0ABD3PCI8_9STRA